MKVVYDGSELKWCRMEVCINLEDWKFLAKKMRRMREEEERLEIGMKEQWRQKSEKLGFLKRRSHVPRTRLPAWMKCGNFQVNPSFHVNLMVDSWLYKSRVPDTRLQYSWTVLSRREEVVYRVHDSSQKTWVGSTTPVRKCRPSPRR